MAWWEWVFSGVGVAAVGWVASALFPKKSSTVSRVSTVAPSIEAGSSGVAIAKVGENSGLIVGGSLEQVVHHHYSNAPAIAIPTPSRLFSYQAKPTPCDLDEAYWQATPFVRTQVQHNFVGLAVEWTLRLRSVHHLPDFFVIKSEDRIYPHELVATYSDDAENDFHRTCSVTVRVNCDEYPRLKSLPSDAPFKVRGLIAAMTSSTPTVEAHDVEFPETS